MDVGALASEAWGRVGGMVSAWGLKVLGALAVLLIGWWLCRVARSSARRALGRSRIDATLVPFLSGLVYYTLLTLVLLAALNAMGVSTTSALAVLGAAGLAVGLALKDTLAHFAAGAMLLFFRPFRAGDYVEIADKSGTVTEVGIFTTNLDTPDNVRIIVPNGEIWGQTIKNYAVNDTRRLDLVLGISYGDDIPTAIEVARRVVGADARVLAEPAPVFAVGELGDSSVNILVRPWCRRTDYWSLRWDLLHRLKLEIEKAGCTIPFPQRDVHLFREEGGQGVAEEAAS